MKNAILVSVPDGKPASAVFYDNPDEAKRAYRDARPESGRLELWNSRRGRIKSKRAEAPAVDSRPPGTVSAADTLPPVPVPGAPAAQVEAPKRRGRPRKVKPEDGAAPPPAAQETPPPPEGVNTAEPPAEEPQAPPAPQAETPPDPAPQAGEPADADF